MPVRFDITDNLHRRRLQSRSTPAGPTAVGISTECRKIITARKARTTFRRPSTYDKRTAAGVTARQRQWRIWTTTTPPPPPAATRTTRRNSPYTGYRTPVNWRSLHMAAIVIVAPKTRRTLTIAEATGRTRTSRTVTIRNIRPRTKTLCRRYGTSANPLFIYIYIFRNDEQNDIWAQMGWID